MARCRRCLTSRVHETPHHGRAPQATPLIWAASNGHDSCVTLLLDRNANIEAQDKVPQRQGQGMDG